jgi:hypothetical protein
MTGGSVNIGKGDRAILMMQGNGDSYGVHYEIPVRNGVPGVETEFRSWPVEILEARIDSIIATLPRDSVVSDSNHTLLQDFGSITGQIVSRYDGALHARYDIQVVLDNGRTATTNSWGTFHLEGRAGTHVLTFPGTAIEPKKVRIRAGCFDFVQITAPR